jgi:hypothetical protein
LVFFDEFDTKDFEWLKYFLAPMQDGTFKAGESMYRIGRAIFVFAGGVSKSWSEFCGATRNPEDENKFRRAKGTDFVSRLRGYLDIASINSTEDGESTKLGAAGNGVSALLMFRRAILLRSLLEDNLSEIIDGNSKEAKIDEAVVSAFLQIKKYQHESRSMQAIIEMSRVSPRVAFQRSSLPASDQLAMHVDAGEFYKLMDGIAL